MPSEDEQDKERSKISLKIGEVQVELEGTYDNIKKLMDKELVDFAKGLEATTKQLPPSTANVSKITPKAPEVAPKEKTVLPPSKPSPTPETPSKTSRWPTLGKKTEKTGKKKFVSRNAAIALVLVLVLLASLVSVIAIYVPMVNDLNSQIAEKDDTIVSLSTQISAFQSVINQLSQNLTDKDAQIADLTSSLDTIEANLTETYNSILSEYNSIIGLGKSGYLVSAYTITQGQNASTVIWDDILQYAGYITVAVESTSNTTYVRVAYSSYDVDYDQNVTLGTIGGTALPILPGEILISIGNIDPNVGESVNATVTVNYIY